MSEQEAQAEGAQLYAAQALPSLSAYRPSEDQLEKLTKHMERQAAMGELPWPLGAQGGLKGIVASHQVPLVTAGCSSPSGSVLDALGHRS